MELFISWSGDRSQKVAKALHEWIPRVIQAVEPWFSPADIGAGARWHQELGQRLETCNFGIICLTPENCESRWLLYEAGGLSKSIDESRVVPFLIGFRKADLDGPLSHFQSVEANEQGTWEMMKAINKATAGTDQPRISEEELRIMFDVWWPKLETSLMDAAEPTDGDSLDSAKRDPHEMTVEIVENTRNIARRLESLINQLPQNTVPDAPKKPMQSVPQPEVIAATRKLILDMLPGLEAEATNSAMDTAIDKWRSIAQDEESTFEKLDGALKSAKSLRAYLDR